ncbi:MAG: acetate/propionate family kinase [Ignavibacteriaceae bacterium]
MNKIPIQRPRDSLFILTINGGSSSIKFALYQPGKSLKKSLNGSVDRVGLPGTNLNFSESDGKPKESLILESSDTRSAANFLIDWLEKKIDFPSIKGIGHRVVFGLNHTEPESITQELVNELHRISPYDMDHLPAEIELIEAMQHRYPEIPQVACYDTAFHHTMPRVAKILPIPRRFEALGIRRYGFHGLSYSYLIEELARTAGTKAAQGRVILAHLGSGASLAAVNEGKSIDTSMGFTPAGGLMMGTRPGDLDPGVAWYMMKSENLTNKQFNKIINHDSGLLGISETSSDMRDLLAKETDDVRAAEAVGLFCYQAKKWIGAFAAALGGLDTLVFAGGIGEESPVIRSRICKGLEFLGIELEEKQNTINAPLISTNPGRVSVRVIRTDEEWMIAQSVSRILKLDFEKD